MPVGELVQRLRVGAAILEQPRGGDRHDGVRAVRERRQVEALGVGVAAPLVTVWMRESVDVRVCIGACVRECACVCERESECLGGSEGVRVCEGV